MGIWAGIKHALNSTLGTADFKPLDKMLADQFRMNASDEVYATLWSSFSITSKTSAETIRQEYSKKIKMTRPGTGYFKGTFKRSMVSDITGYFYIYKNGEQIFSEGYKWGNGDATIEFSTLVSFDTNDVFSFELYMYNANDGTASRTCSVENFTLNGSIVQNVFVEM